MRHIEDRIAPSAQDGLPLCNRLRPDYVTVALVEAWRRFGRITYIKGMLVEAGTAPKQREYGTAEDDAAELKLQRDAHMLPNQLGHS